MLHGHQGSYSLIGPYGYLIAAADVAADADEVAAHRPRREVVKAIGLVSLMYSVAKSAFAGLQNLGAWIGQSQRRQTD